MAFLDQVSALADQYFAKGGTVATKPVARFAPGGDVEPGDAMSPGEEDAARDATTGGSLGGSAGDFEGVDFGGGDDGAPKDDDEDPKDDGDTPPRDEDPRDDGDDQRVVSDTPTAAEAIMAARGPAVDPAIQEAIKTQAAVQAARATKTPASSVAPKEKESVTEKALQVDEFGPLFDTPATRPSVPADGTAAAAAPPSKVQELGDRDTTEADFVGTTSVRAPSPYEQGTLPAGTYTEKDLKQAQRELAAAQRAAPPTFGEAAGKPRMSQAGILGAIVDAVANPEATLANAISERGIRSLDGEETGREGGLEVVQADGRTAAYDPERNIVFDSDPFKGIDPFGDERVPKGIQDLYDKQRAKDEEERERDGRGDEPILPEDVAVEEEAGPKLPPTIDIVPFRPEDFYYFTQQQRQGLPSMMNMRTR